MTGTTAHIMFLCLAKVSFSSSCMYFFKSLYPGKFLRNLDIIKYKSIHTHTHYIYIYVCINHQGDLRNFREGTNPISYNLLREMDSVMLLAHAELVKVLEIQHVISRGIAVSISG